MKKSLFCSLIVAAAATTYPLQAEVPQIIQYQSYINVGGVGYNGMARFKFALIDSKGTASFWSNDGSSANGSEPVKDITLAIVGGHYSISLGDTGITNMTPLSPVVFTNSSVRMRVWFSDGQSAFQQVAPDQEFTSVAYAMTAATVANGAVTAAQLADGAVTAGKLAPGSVTSAAIASGAVSAYELAPNAAIQNLGSSGGLVLSDKDNATNLLAAGFQRLGKIMADGDQFTVSAPFSPAPKANHAAVWTGKEMIIWGGMDYSYHFDRSGAIYDFTSDSWKTINTGNAPASSDTTKICPAAVWMGEEMIVLAYPSTWKIYNKANNTWRNVSASNAPPGIVNATFTWTGSELLVMGSLGCKRYDPVADRWATIATTNNPASHTAVWTGSELILWGGSAAPFSNGAIYNPATGVWRGVSKLKAPTPRTGHQAVWTGNSMIVWGGQTTANRYGENTGAIYYPSTDTWQPISTLGAPTGRLQFSAIWTGNAFLVFGGFTRSSGQNLPYAFYCLNDGGKYDPATDTWTTIDAGPLEPNIGYSTVWTGSEMILWGGGSIDPRKGVIYPYITQNDYQNSGWAFNPKTGVWRHLSFTPIGRVGFSAVWTGSEYIVWGGCTNPSSSTLSYGLLRDGGRFNPKKGTWTPISNLNAPSKRRNHQAVWTGKEMIVWGGLGVPDGTESYTVTSVLSLNTGARYNPVLDRWFPMATNGVPSTRSDFTMVWSGKEAIVFGGYNDNKLASPTGYLNSGGRYDPELDAWRSASAANAPSPRSMHAAVWTGEEMIVWGGKGALSTATSASLQVTGARYNPVLNSWIPMSSEGGPRGSMTQFPAAFWTGQEMVFWGHGIPVGARYQPATDQWQPMNLTLPASDLLSSPVNPVWTGDEMLLCNNSAMASRANKTGRFNPDTGLWSFSSAMGGPVSRTLSSTVWTGSEMLIFGGLESSKPVSSVVRLHTSATLYLYGKP